MDIIAAHQQGLIEQLDHEVAALAGQAGDHGQRAVVLHHLFDHSRGEHRWALAEACRAARIATGLRALERRLAGWGWRAVARDEARAALDGLAMALGEAARDRVSRVSAERDQGVAERSRTGAATGAARGARPVSRCPAWRRGNDGARA